MARIVSVPRSISTSLVGLVLHRGENRLIAELGGAGVLGQNLVANLYRLDRPEAGHRVDRRAGREARVGESILTYRSACRRESVRSWRAGGGGRVINVALLLLPPFLPGLGVLAETISVDRGQDADDPCIALVDRFERDASRTRRRSFGLGAESGRTIRRGHRSCRWRCVHDSLRHSPAHRASRPSARRVDERFIDACRS